MGKADTYAKKWLRHRTVLLDLLDRIPEDKVDFKPWEKAMSLSELALHIATGGDWFVTAVKTGKFGKPSEEKAGSITELKSKVRELTDKTQKDIESLTDEQLDAIVSAQHVLGFDAPGKVFLDAMREHEIHHKGQLFVYARLVGVEDMPFFINNKM